MNRSATCALSAISEIDTTVSMSTAATRSTTVRPRSRRRTPNRTPREIRIAATIRMPSAKDLLQTLLERPGDLARRLVGIGGFYIEPVNEQAVLINVDHQRAGRQCDRVRQREPAHGCFQPGLDLDDPGIDVDARCEPVTHHVDIGAHELDSAEAGVPDEVIEQRGRETHIPPH